MKKMLSFILALVLCLTAFSAFAESTPTQFPALGMEITMPENAADMGLDVIAKADILNLTFVNDEEFTALLLIERMNDAMYDQVFSDEATANVLAATGMKTLGRQDGYTYIAFVASDFEDVSAYFTGVLGVDYNAFSDETKAAIDAALPLVKAAAESLSFIPIVPEEKTVGTFQTTDVNGSEVTESIFSGYDLTVVNVWGTFCGPCINEMPELAAWVKELPENVQLVGIVSDVYTGDDASTAKAIMDKTGVTFPNLLASPTMVNLLSEVQYVPTTFFVDGEGNIVGEPIIGAYVSQYKQFVEDYLK